MASLDAEEVESRERTTRMVHQNEDRVEVTEENFGDLLIQGLEEVRAIARGESEPARRVSRLRTRTRGNCEAAPLLFRPEHPADPGEDGIVTEGLCSGVERQPRHRKSLGAEQAATRRDGAGPAGGGRAPPGSVAAPRGR